MEPNLHHKKQGKHDNVNSFLSQKFILSSSESDSDDIEEGKADVKEYLKEYNRSVQGCLNIRNPTNGGKGKFENSSSKSFSQHEDLANTNKSCLQFLPPPKNAAKDKFKPIHEIKNKLDLKEDDDDFDNRLSGINSLRYDSKNNREAKSFTREYFEEKIDDTGFRNPNEASALTSQHKYSHITKEINRYLADQAMDANDCNSKTGKVKLMARQKYGW